jgi:type II secretory pathway component PulK
MIKANRPRQEKARRGVILLAVLVALVILTLAAYQYSDMMVAEYRAADNAHRAAQARALAESGIHYAAALLSNADMVNNTLGGNVFDNPQYFRDIEIPAGENDRFGRFSLIAPLDPNGQNVSAGRRFGVTDEGGKLNLNVLIQLDPTGTRLFNALMLLPNMTSDIANAIVDWLDSDNTPRDGGAEDDYYMSLSPPYHAKNGALESLDELLLVRGVTVQLLYGSDLNRNGIIDPEEDDGSGAYNLGWAAFLTIYSREQNSDPQGNPYTYLNSNDLTTLYQTLTTQIDDPTAKFIVLYRQYGGSNSTGGNNSNNPASGNNSNNPGSSNNATGNGGGGGNGGQGGGGQTGGQAGGGQAGGGQAGGGQAGGFPTGGRKNTSQPSKGNTSQPGKGNTGQPGMQKNQGGKQGTGAFVLKATSGGNVAGTQNTPAPQPGDLGSVELDFTLPAKSQIKSIWQLINATVTVPGENGKPATIYTSPLSDPSSQNTLLPLIFSMTTLSQGNEIPARININTAPQEVLGTIPELADSDIQTIIATRPQLSGSEAADPIYQTPAWLLLKANLTIDTLQQLDNYISTRSQVFRVQSVGYIDDKGAAARVEAIIDTNGGRPRILGWRDLTPLGKGYDSGL